MLFYILYVVSFVILVGTNPDHHTQRAIKEVTPSTSTADIAEGSAEDTSRDMNIFE